MQLYEDSGIQPNPITRKMSDNNNSSAINGRELEDLKRRISAVEDRFNQSSRLPSFLKSKKAWTAIIGTAGGVSALLGFDNLSSTELATALSPLVAYIIGQGIADNGKEKAKIEKQA